MITFWLYGIEPDLSGKENMERDEMMVEACRRDGIPRLRFYSWRPYTLSLGFNQAEEQINRAELAQRGYGLVRRPTGGRAVFHAEELTYAVAMPADGATLHAAYARINEALCRGLQALGAEGVEFSRTQPDFRRHYGRDESAGCFSASARNELTWQGRKLAGSAQRRYGDLLLQHGSLLLGEAHLDIAALMQGAGTAEQQRRLRKLLAGRTSTLREILNGKLPSFEKIAEALSRGFAETFDVRTERVDDVVQASLSTETETISR